MFTRFLAISLVVATAYSSAFGSCLDYGILGLNAKKGGNKNLTKTALVGSGATLAGTYITSSVAVSKSAAIGSTCIAVGSSALLATGVIAGVASVGVITYLIKKSKNTNTDLLVLANQIVNKQVSLESFNESDSLINQSHVKLSSHLKRFIRLRNELNENLAGSATLTNYDLAELIVYLDKNTYVKNSERIHAIKEKSMPGVNPFCSFTRTKIALKKGKILDWQLSRKTYKHNKLVKLLTAAFEARAINANVVLPDVSDATNTTENSEVVDAANTSEVDPINVAETSDTPAQNGNVETKIIPNN